MKIESKKQTEEPFLYEASISIQGVPDLSVYVKVGKGVLPTYGCNGYYGADWPTVETIYRALRALEVWAYPVFRTGEPNAG